MSAAAQARRGDLRSYALVTGAYWADTVTDGAIRPLVLFYFFVLHAPFARSSVPKPSVKKVMRVRQ